jgi:putative membrane protein
MKRSATLAVWLCLAVATPALAQYPKRAPKEPAGGYTAAQKAQMAKGLTPDAAFVIAAAQSAYAGATFAKLALEKASSPDVKRYARRAADVNGRLSEELKPLLKAQQAPEPAALDKRNQAVNDWLGRLSGADFDRAYMSNTTSMKASDVMVFQRAADMAHDADLKSWATKNLVTMKQHQESALAISKKIASH